MANTMWFVMHDLTRNLYDTKPEAEARARFLYPQDDAYELNKRIYSRPKPKSFDEMDEEKIQAWIKGEIEL